MNSNAACWFEIYVNDMSRAKKFYQSVFDRQLEKLPTTGIEMWAFPGNEHGYGAPGALVYTPDFPAGNNSVLVYFSCADCAVEENKVTQFGGEIVQSKSPIGQYGFIALVRDTEGNMIGLHSLK